MIKLHRCVYTSVRLPWLRNPLEETEKSLSEKYQKILHSQHYTQWTSPLAWPIRTTEFIMTRCALHTFLFLFIPFLCPHHTCGIPRSSVFFFSWALFLQQDLSDLIISAYFVLLYLPSIADENFSACALFLDYSAFELIAKPASTQASPTLLFVRFFLWTFMVTLLCSCP